MVSDLDNLDRCENESDDDKKLENILKWCKEKVLDHIAIYILVRQTNKYYFLSDNGQQNGLHNLRVPFDNFRSAFARSSGICDKLYDTTNIVIYSISKNGFNRNDRERLQLSIDHMILTGEYKE